MNAAYRFGVYLFGDATKLAKAAKDGEDALKRLGARSVADHERSTRTRLATGTKAEREVLREAERTAKARSVVGIRADRDIQREIQRTQAAYNRLARAGTLSWQEQARASQKTREEVARLTSEMGRLTSGQLAMRDANRMTAARQALGVRAERDIQREIQRTEGAYGRLARSGTLSWREQWAAARKTREEVTRLTNEMGRLTARQKVAAGFKGVAAAGVGVGAATAMIAPKVQTSLDYDMRVAHLANTAFSDKGTHERRAGLGEINAMIVDAVRTGGGTRESAVGAAEALFGAGIFKPGEIATILRQAVKAGTATNTDSAAFAQMAITARQTMGIAPDRAGAMFGMGTFAGQQGGFEIKDMAKWLPQQMAAAKAVGMSGEAGFAKLAALNQAAIVTAGTRDEAGNNVVNLLAKIGSMDTRKDFKKQGVDLPKELAEGRMKGLDALDVVGNLLQQQLAKDKNFQAVQKQLADSKTDADRRGALEAVGNIAQGTVIGKVFQDRQALMGLYGYMQGRDRVGSIARGALGNTDAADRNFGLVSSMAGFKVEQRKQEQEIALHASMEKLTPAIGSLNEGVTGLMRRYPQYTTAIWGATTALVALAGSAFTLALLNGGKVPGGGVVAGAGRALGKLGGAVSGGGGMGGIAGVLGKLGLAGAVAGLFTTSDEEMSILRNADRKRAGYRGKGFTDPRVIGSTVAERLGNTGGNGGAGASALPLLQQDLKGEILLTVKSEPGVAVQAETRSSNPRIPFRTDAGRSNTAAGF